MSIAIAKAYIENMEAYMGYYFRLNGGKVNKAFEKWANDHIPALRDCVYDLLKEGTNLKLTYRTIRKISYGAAFRTLGWCRLTRTNNGVCELHFSYRAFYEGSEKECMDTFVHELIHSMLNFEEGHGRAFQTACRYLNRILEMHLGTVCHKSPIPFKTYDDNRKYYLVCAKCGKIVSKYMRKGKTWTAIRNGAIYTHRNDGGRIIAVTKAEYEEAKQNTIERIAACNIG